MNTLRDRLKLAKSLILGKGEGWEGYTYQTSLKQDREAIYKDLLELVGADEEYDIAPNGDPIAYSVANYTRRDQNHLRAELRNKLKDYCGVEK